MSKQLPYTYQKFLSSEMFTILAGPSLKPFRVHKQLLAEVSAELKGHVFNEMKEGIEGSMEMPHVSEETMCQFLEFCYTGDYPEIVEVGTGEKEKIKETETPEAPPSLETHEESSKKLHPNAKLYILGDMYNIPRLKSTAFGNITAIIRYIGCIDSKCEPLVETYIELFKYTCENLPEHTEKNTDPLLEYLGKLAAWNLDAFRKSENFIMIFQDYERVDFVRLVLENVRRSEKPPWEEEVEACNELVNPESSSECEDMGFSLFD